MSRDKSAENNFKMMFAATIFWLGLLPIVTLGEFPNNPCHVEGQVCKKTEDNLLNFISDVKTLEECQGFCYANSNCFVFNYFGANSSQFTNSCMILSACDNLQQCENCFAEYSYCHRSCASPVEGPMNDNVIGFLQNKTELECKSTCNATGDCSFYTYLEKRKTCFLLNALKYPLTTCENCVTAPVDCNEGICGFNHAQQDPSLVITKSTKVSIFRLGRCSQLKALAMGPGGDYSVLLNFDCYYYNGAGSGYLNFTHVPINGVLELSITVGEKSGDSSSIVGDNGSVILEAACGEDGQFGSAGDGYSGGGGSGHVCTYSSTTHGGAGGCNGSSGQDGEGGFYPDDAGMGSGFSVDELPFQVLSIR